jgi:acetyl esterase/lipase
MEGDELYAGEMLHRLATQGWMVISAGYPLSSPQRHLWNQTTAQIGCALAWTNANAAQYGGDPQRISLLGQSAGGNLVLNAASLANAGTLPSSCEGLVPHVAAVVAVYPVVHLVEAYHNKAPFISKVGRAFFDAYTGGTPEQFPERYAVIDPASHINPTGPPTLIMVGEHDDLLPPQPTYRYADELRTAGVHVELMRLPFGQHAYDVMQGSIGYQLTLGMTRKFLSAQGQGPEPPQ